MASRKSSRSFETAEAKHAMRAPQRGNAAFDPDERKLEDRLQRPRRDDDDVLEREQRVSRMGPNSEADEAEVAEEDILEEIDVGELRYG